MKSTQPLARATVRALQFVTRQAVLLLAGLGLVYSLLLFARNSSLSTRIIDAVFNQSFKGSIHWQRLNFGPLPWTIEIAGLDIRDGNGDSVIVADALSIGRIDLPQLSIGNIHLQDVVLSNLKVSLRRVDRMENAAQISGAERPLNIVQVFELIKPKPKEVSTTEMTIKVDDITLSNGSFELIDDDIEIRTGTLNSQDMRFGLLVQPAASELNIRVPALSASQLAVGVGAVTSEGRALN